ncbi:hypothetical protein CANARDRAFT_201333 [[Candida] arabinofermentans NRRL YB-2248]|uniref:Uncharacterized protein n=1 Tax=[Candida] arabinofermentans NRRL YB-2248 TaxID=983967 RepID=A0A1E4SXI2_9ASCO|nr:hypothetical protein CANARDRAFT_201333 [[Candida] arabinofermentans NRRL YB-2248]
MSDYTCLKCKLPLQLDDSLEGLSNAQKHLLTLSYGQRPPTAVPNTITHDNLFDEYPIIPEERMNLVKQSNALSGGRSLISTRKTESSTSIDEGSFVILDDKTQQQQRNENNLDKIPVSDRVSTMDNIFSILSSKYEIDYPVCSDCANNLIEELKQRFDQLTKEKDTYVQFLKKLTVQTGPNHFKANEALNELDTLEKEKDDLLKETEDLERERSDLYFELAEVEKELEELNVQEKEYCSQKNKYETELTEFINERERVKSLYEYNLNQLDSLRKTNVLNDTFLISYDDQFGTINGLRLGNLDDVKVSWHEINAALGQFVLLLSTVVKILNFKLEGYRLIPMGSTSRIEKFERDPKHPGKLSKVTLDLFSTGEFSIGRLFTHNKLDDGMVALVDILSHIGNKLKQLDELNDLPYKMTRDKVAGYNIRPSMRSSNEEWTAACRYLLTNAKWVLTYCISHY